MIDDLVTKGITEPYRMFTSRAEYRLMLREDNADLRLRKYGHRIGLVSDMLMQQVEWKQRSLVEGRTFLRALRVRPTAATNGYLAECGSSPITEVQSGETVIKRPEIALEDVLALSSSELPSTLFPNISESLEIEVKYEGYIQIQQQELERLERLKETVIPATLNFSRVDGLSREVQERLTKQRPLTLADASLLPGVTPAALSSLLYHLRQVSQEPASL